MTQPANNVYGAEPRRTLPVEATGRFITIYPPRTRPYWRVYYCDETITVNTSRSSLAEAEQLAYQLWAQLQSATPATTEEIDTVGDLFDWWIEEKQTCGAWNPKTTSNAKDTFARWILTEGLAREPVAVLQERDARNRIAKLMKSASDNGAPRGSHEYQRIGRLINECLRFADAEQMLTFPFGIPTRKLAFYVAQSKARKGTDHDYSGVQSIKREAVPPDQCIRDLEDAAQEMLSHVEYLRIGLMRKGGLRVGEALGIPVEAIPMLPVDEIEVHQQYVEYTQKQQPDAQLRRITTDPKHGIQRETWVPHEFAELLRAQRSRREAQGARPSDPLLPAPNGGWQCRRNFRGRAWTPVLEAAGWPSDGVRHDGSTNWLWKPHSLRHSYAERLLRERVPITTVAQYLGHQSPRITERLYWHWTDTRIADTSRVFEGKEF